MAGTELPVWPVDKMSERINGSIIESFPLPPGVNPIKRFSFVADDKAK
jgi:hypothetical protein